MTTIKELKQTTVTNVDAKAPTLRGGYAVKTPSRGGARPGAGRKKGSTPKYSLEELMTQIQKHTGRPFAEQVAVNYANAIERNDHAGIRDYDRVLLGKMVADKQEIATVESEDSAMAKAQAFAEELKKLSTR